MAKLTHAQLAILRAFADRGPLSEFQASTIVRSRGGVGRSIKVLVAYGDLEPDNWCYRITPAGRAALEQEK